MRILVCFKTVPNWERVLERDWAGFAPNSDIGYAGQSLNCFDEAALETALRLKDGAAKGGEGAWCAAVTVGKLAPGFAQSLYAAGFDEVVHIPLEESEFAPARVAGQLAACARKLDAGLVLTGWMAGMADTGAVPYLLAGALGLPILPEALAAEWAEGGLAVTTQNRQGVWFSRARLPLVASMGNSTAVLRAVPLRARLQAKTRMVAQLGPFDEVSPVSSAEQVAVRLTRPHTARQCRVLPAQPPDEAARALIEAFGTDDGSAIETSKGIGVALPPGLKMVAYQVAGDAPGLPAALADELLSDWETRRPDLALFPPTAQGRQLLTWLSARAGAADMSGVTTLEMRDGQLFARKKVCASNLEWERALPLPALVGLAAPPVEGVEVVVLGTDEGPDDAARPGWLLERRLLEPAVESGLESARRVIICGAGMADKAAIERARHLAQKLGAGFGVTRGALLNGWGGPEELVGQSGALLAPEACLVLGASGARAFMVGIEGAGRVLAVNRDAGALVFSGADLGLCADAAGLVDALLTLLE